jgi:hypothetical protein
MHDSYPEVQTICSLDNERNDDDRIQEWKGRVTSSFKKIPQLKKFMYRLCASTSCDPSLKIVAESGKEGKVSYSNNPSLNPSNTQTQEKKTQEVLSSRMKLFQKRVSLRHLKRGYFDVNPDSTPGTKVPLKTWKSNHKSIAKKKLISFKSNHHPDFFSPRIDFFFELVKKRVCFVQSCEMSFKSLPLIESLLRVFNPFCLMRTLMMTLKKEEQKTHVSFILCVIPKEDKK